MANLIRIADRTDVLVIGAGPAGCAAAIRARQAGLRVVVLDSRPEPRAAPGETLHPGIEPILKQLGILGPVLRSGSLRHRGIWIETAGKRDFLPYGGGPDGPWTGYQVDRRAFHKILQQTLVRTKATLIRNARADSVLIERGRVAGATTEDCTIRARWTVDATGRLAWLARQLNLTADLRSPPLGVRFGWREDACSTLEDQPVFTFRANGWNWHAPLADGRNAWVKLRINNSIGRRPKGMDYTWRLHRDCAGPGYILVGDAAAILDPASSHGVLKALMSGILFGHLAEACWHKKVSEEFLQTIYRSWIVEHFEHDATHLRQIYANSPAGALFSEAVALQNTKANAV